MSCTQTASVAEHIATALSRPLPAEVEEKSKLHLLDTLAAILSGGRLPAGRAGARLAQRLGGPKEALVIANGLRVGAPAAALANAMAAHADETDDSHVGGRFHPGCAVVPAALAVAETQGAGGSALLVALATAAGERPRKSVGQPDSAWLASIPEIVVASKLPRFCPFLIQSPVSARLA